MFERRRFLDLLRYFAVFEDGAAAGVGGSLAKRIAGHYQFDAVNVALEETLRAGETVSADRAVGGRLGSAAGTSRGAPSGDRRVGVVWHTQGSGKSLTMAFYAGRVMLLPAMMNPTLVVLTHRLRRSVVR